jgi:hypothetical protein
VEPKLAMTNVSLSRRPRRLQLFELFQCMVRDWKEARTDQQRVWIQLYDRLDLNRAPRDASITTYFAMSSTVPHHRQATPCLSLCNHKHASYAPPSTITAPVIPNRLITAIYIFLTPREPNRPSRRHLEEMLPYGSAPSHWRIGCCTRGAVLAFSYLTPLLQTRAILPSVMVQSLRAQRLVRSAFRTRSKGAALLARRIPWT